MTQPDAYADLNGNSPEAQAIITIDPCSFFQYASGRAERWRELIGLTINHCTFGLGTIKKIDGEYLYVDLPERQGNKHLTEFGLDSFQRGFFNNLQVNPLLQEKITAAAEALKMAPPLETPEVEGSKRPVKKKRKYTKAPKKAEPKKAE